MILKRTLQNWGLISLILLLFVFLLGPYGPAITFDTVSFLQAGDHLWAEGRYVHYAPDGGLEFAAHRFPLYPLLLSIFYGLPKGAFILQVLLLFGMLLGFRSLSKHEGARLYPLLLLATFSVLLCYYCLWTEALYGCLFACLLFLLSKEDDYQPLYGILTLIGLICLTRMVGLVAGGSLFIAYVIVKRHPRGWLVLLVTFLLIGFWTVLGTYHLGETARAVGIHFASFQDVRDLFIHLGKWMIPMNVPVIAEVVGVILFFTPLVFLGLSKRTKEQRGVLFYFLFVHFYAYILFLFLSKSFIDQSIPIESRTLLPLYLNLIGFLIVFMGYEGFTEKFKVRIKFLVPPLIIIVVLMNSSSLIQLRNNGIGYSSKEWNSYWFVEILDQINGDKVFTNDQTTLYLAAEQIEHPVLLPQKKNLYSDKTNETYTAEMDLMFHELSESENGKIIWIRNGITADIYPSYEFLKEHPALAIVYDDWLCLVLEYEGL